MAAVAARAARRPRRRLTCMSLAVCRCDPCACRLSNLGYRGSLGCALIVSCHPKKKNAWPFHPPQLKRIWTHDCITISARHLGQAQGEAPLTSHKCPVFQNMSIERENSTPNVEAEPLYQPGCKITHGARHGLRPPTWQEAFELVSTKRASERILAPAAARLIQMSWKERAARRREAEQCLADTLARRAVQLQRAWRRRTAMQQLKTWRCASTKVSSAFRGRKQRQQYLRMKAAAISCVLRIQRAARGLLARRSLQAAVRAAKTVQATWRRVSDQVLKRRLTRAADALRKGGSLSKYRKHGAIKERHHKHVWVSDDLQTLHWAPSAEQRNDYESAVATGGTWRAPVVAKTSAVRSIPMAGITAVTDGVKTRLMKKMDRRAAAARHTRDALVSGQTTSSGEPRPAEDDSLLTRTISLVKKPLALDRSCAFSIICHERVLDFIAADKRTRDAWLRNLQTALLYAHHFDHHKAKRSVQKLSCGRPSTC